ncbi:imidazole glycerol phosphate synthase subunit HisH [Selenomonas sp.]|uniref:imidazole glycerol phosphate synthase subunit HisH n=1 Tax=Selenomonas sp. TaxID=2053611 RepID=UPI0025FEF248|nr:imidazole glycerol phosphate synthase subunit HisH [Selenomonas sp.]MCI6086145.1 imidazole glycerol phosphate synthase subunit HisH [Selenomonas sp.]MDY3298484.1 imidazole glycerol phosphate synthase subunit HisH [Selenomonas sp.]MDY4415064.1 imidazole glycerol phosphate synthase subunit HisH [Selenomonas sp.]
MIAVIDYGVGNLFSVEKAVAALGADVKVTSDKETIEAAEKIILPGVGAFGDCMKNLEATGLIPTIKSLVADGRPMLGICVGLQILFDGSEESPGAKGLGLIHGMVKKINAPGLKIPHMGWNSLTIRESREPRDLFHGLQEHPYVYFVHSYHAVPDDPAVITATTEYGEQLTASVAVGNLQATQFHPEKSGDVGLSILKNFIEG